MTGIELGICVEWTRTDSGELLEELRSGNRILANEKNKYLTVFESLPHPAILVNDRFRIENLNTAAVEMLRGERNTPGSQYYCRMRDRYLEEQEGEAGTADCLEGMSVEKWMPWLSRRLLEFSRENDRHRTFEQQIQLNEMPAHFEVKISRLLDDGCTALGGQHGR
jgi:hypothetical protein